MPYLICSVNAMILNKYWSLFSNCREGTEQCCWAQSEQLLSINKTEKTLDFFSVLFYISISNNYCYYLWKGGSLWPL